MNCWPGALAVIVRTHANEPATRQFRDRTVRITARGSSESGCACWNYEGMPLRGKWHGRNVEWHSLPDEWLRPITPPGDEISAAEVQSLYQPSPVSIPESERV
jgi:hypothetical protein